MVWENTEDPGKLRINLVGGLSLGEDVSDLVFTRNPVKLVDSILLSLSYKVETTFDVAGLARELAVFGYLNSCVVVNHDDGGSCRKALY